MNRRALLSLPAFMLAPRVFAAEPIRLRDLYERDMTFSALALTNEGKRIDVAGFMAPPLRAESHFFVLTKMPMAVCPFCEPGQTWPDDILAVYARRVVEVVRFTVPLVATGVLELGDYVDPDLGFFSKVRLTAATFTRA